jgi:hypothetical protein
LVVGNPDPTKEDLLMSRLVHLAVAAAASGLALALAAAALAAPAPKTVQGTVGPGFTTTSRSPARR